MKKKNLVLKEPILEKMENSKMFEVEKLDEKIFYYKNIFNDSNFFIDF